MGRGNMSEYYFKINLTTLEFRMDLIKNKETQKSNVRAVVLFIHRSVCQLSLNEESVYTCINEHPRFLSIRMKNIKYHKVRSNPTLKYLHLTFSLLPPREQIS